MKNFHRWVLVLLILCLPTTASAMRLPEGFAETLVASGLASPTAMAIAPDGRIFVCQQTGELRVIKNNVLLPEPFLKVAVSTDGERGLVGVVFDPDFESNGWVYVYYTALQPVVHNRLSRFTADGDRAVPGSETALVDLPVLQAPIHNGGAMHFGPDGKLYLAVGENARAMQAQVLTTPFGKILRLNRDGTIPADNPFYSQTTGLARAIWALGFRNPFTFAFQQETGRLFVNDVGASTWEEINEGMAGANYGWPETEGPTDDTRFRAPLFTYPHPPERNSGCAITGGVFYEAEEPHFPEIYHGNYFFADYCRGWIRRFDPAAGIQGTYFAFEGLSPVDLDVAPDGALFVLQRNAGTVVRIDYTATLEPHISVQPSDATVSVGETASFSVVASGAAPLLYQWRRGNVDIPGATAARLTLPAAVLGDNRATFSVVVRNESGSATSRAATLTVTTNRPPVPVITAPANRTLYRAGDRIDYAGTASDPEDGKVSPARFTWWVDLHHDVHFHPFVAPKTGAIRGSFVIPRLGETSANVFYRIHLRVADKGGRTAETSVDIVPRKALLSLATEPAGLKVTLDGNPVTTPLQVLGVVGARRALGVVSPQNANGKSWVFAGWSDGGDATHEIKTPGTATTYTARFRTAGTGQGTGLTGNYWDELGFNGKRLTRNDPIVDFNWGEGPPIPGIEPDFFTARWTGRIEAAVSGAFTFYIASDDGMRLWIDNKLLIDHWGSHPLSEAQGAITLQAGQRYNIRVDYQEREDTAIARLLWSATGLPKQVVPATRLYPK